MENDRVLLALRLALEAGRSGEPDILDFAKLFKDAEQCVTVDQCAVCRIAQVPQTNAELQEHHVARKTNFPDTVTVCLRCHEHLSDHQKNWLVNEADMAHRLSSYLFGWADIFDLLNRKSGRPCFLSLARKFRSQGWHVRNNARER
jgi:hypothetical protein